MFFLHIIKFFFTLFFYFKISFAEKFAIVDTLIYDGLGTRPNADHKVLIENSKQYCVRHGYHYALAETEFPLFNHTPCIWNVATTQFIVVQTLLSPAFSYNWVMYKQIDSAFVNLDLPLTAITPHVPLNAHMVLAAKWPFLLNDDAVLFRNSPEGRVLLKRLTHLQEKMHLCAAPGMATINVFLFHLLNGTLVDEKPVFYNGECETPCINNNAAKNAKHDHSWDAVFNYRPIFQCLEKWHFLFNLTRWHVEEVHIPGVWIMPGNDEVVLKNGYPSLCDDITSFGSGPPRYLKSFNEIPGNVLVGPDRHVAHTSAFKKRFNTTLLLHQGGGGRYDYDLFLPKDIFTIFPPLTYKQKFRRIGSNIMSEKKWNFLLSAFKNVSASEKKNKKLLM